MFNILLHLPFCLIKQTNIVTVLTISIVFFLVVLIFGIKKSYQLKAENKKLMKATEDLLKEEEQTYTDFTEGHMYNNSNKNE